MKPIDKKDQPKLFALIGMAVLCFGFGAYQFASSSTARPVAAPAASPTPTPAEQQLAAAEDDSVWKPEGNASFVPSGGRDPFMPEGMAAPQPSPTPTAAPKPTPEPTETNGPRPPLPNWGGKQVEIPGPKVPPLDLGVGKKVGVTLIHATPTPPPPAPTLELSGVIVAEDTNRSKAIFKTEKSNRILGIGDSAGNGWRVADIQERKVEIIDPKTGRRATVELE